MRCPYCQHHDSKVLDTSHDSHGGIRRRRECFKCGQRFSTYERPILATPLIFKQDGTREEFDPRSSRAAYAFPVPSGLFPLRILSV